LPPSKTTRLKLWARHELQFGVQFRWEQVTKKPDKNVSVDLNTLATSQYDRTSTVASPLSVPQPGWVSQSDARRHQFQHDVHADVDQHAEKRFTPYFQDNWKISPRLTLNLGMRWELWTPVFDKNNSLLSFR